MDELFFYSYICLESSFRHAYFALIVLMQNFINMQFILGYNNCSLRREKQYTNVYIIHLWKGCFHGIFSWTLLKHVCVYFPAVA